MRTAWRRVVLVGSLLISLVAVHLVSLVAVHLVSLVAVLLVSLVAVRATAQSLPLGDSDASTQTRDTTEEMIVTGSQSPRAVSTIPLSTSVLEGEALDRSLSTSLDDALRL